MKTLRRFLLICMTIGSISFIIPARTEPTEHSYWIRFCIDYANTCGYVNSKGDTMIPAGKYFMCETDTFRSYAIVYDDSLGLIGINKQEKMLYNVHVMDNGPDPVHEGLFRIWKNGLMGYADERTGKIILYPQFTCGFEFRNGKAKVSLTACKSVPASKNSDYHHWETEEWFYIDHTGKKVDPPKE